MFENLTASGAIPSLNALRAFEAMARTGGATRAAAELNVTHSAVSRQVKALEAQLGLRLFEGPRHALTLTEAGRGLLPGLTAAFDQIAAAVAEARGTGRDLHVAVNASLAVKWLIPRLADFNRLHPQVRVHLVELAPHAVSRRGADMLLRLLDTPRIEALGAIAVIPNAVGPVIAPALAQDDARTAVLTAPRLTPRTHATAWKDWAGLSRRRLPRARAAGRPSAFRPGQRPGGLGRGGAALGVDGRSRDGRTPPGALRLRPRRRGRSGHPRRRRDVARSSPAPALALRPGPRHAHGAGCNLKLC